MIFYAGFRLGGAIAERNAGQLELIMKVSPGAERGEPGRSPRKSEVKPGVHSVPVDWRRARRLTGRGQDGIGVGVGVGVRRWRFGTGAAAVDARQRGQGQD